MQRKVVFGWTCALIALAACSKIDGGEASSGAGGEGGTSSNAPSGGAGGFAGMGGFSGSAGSSSGTGGSSGAGNTGGNGGTAGVMAESGGTGAAGAAGGDAGVDNDASVDESTPGPFPPVTDFEAAGPYTSTMTAGVGPNSNYTLYRPTELAPNGAKNPIVVWMSGGGTDPSWYTLLPHLATHGFVVVASNTIPGIGTEDALGEELVAGIDWAIAEDTRAGSELEGKLDTTKIASVGYSMGSLATFTMAMDERLTTTVHISGGNMAPERVDNLHAPAAFICGIPGEASCGLLDTACDIAAANCATDFANATTPVFYATFPNGHLGIMTAPFDVRIAGMTAEWLRYHLMADTTRKASFVGADCAYCSSADWEIQQKNLD